MTILDRIIKSKINEVEERKSLYPEKLLERSIFFETKPVSLKHYILRPDKAGIIAEFKRKSPSRGFINEYASIEKISIGYMQGGASALSILTDSEYFGGRSEDLITARKLNYCPILRKDFIIDEYQVIESKSIGADAVLLIASILEKKNIIRLGKKAKELGMEVLLEIHKQEDIKKLNDYTDIAGVNNRDLRDFQVSTDISKKLSESIPADYLKISESGIRNAADIKDLREYGYKGFLIGDLFMRSSEPEKACAGFVKTIINL